MNLEVLNKQQQEAIVIDSGATLVIAGAGSGKTRVLTYKIAKLIEDGYHPSSILAITFTNKAAKEMKERIIDLVGDDANYASISTFHSFGARVLRYEIDVLGYEKNFTILDSNDQKSVIKLIIKDMNLDPKFYNVRSIMSRISNYKNEGITSVECKVIASTQYERDVAKIYENYESRLQSSNCLDFDDLLILPVKIFNKFPEIASKYQTKYQYVLVDEYQDTNSLQYQLIRILSKKSKNIFVVGDGDQSIYSWRGANIENILNFEKDFDDAKVVLLEQNYRSTKTIIEAANNLIDNNMKRKPKHLFTDNEEGELVEYFTCVNEQEEVEKVLSEVVKLLSQKVDLNEIAILYRTNAQSRVFEEQLLRENIAYNIVGSYYFYARKEIKDLLAYLRLILNSNDDISFMRVVNEPKRGIGASTIEKLRDVARANGTSLYESVRLNYLSDRANGNLQQFVDLIEDFKQYSKEHSLSHIIEYVLEKSGYMVTLSEDNIENNVRREYLEEFTSVAKIFEETHEEITLESFLEETSLVADMKQYEDIENKLTLMTMHGAKGLEYDYVFIVGMEEDILPHRNSCGSNDELEEERRLCYVGITRARKKLYISNATTRMFLGARTMNRASRFVNEIGKHLMMQNGEVVETPKSTFNASSYDTSTTNDGEFNVGDKVLHKMFGKGIVVSIDDSIMNIAFADPHGLKKISLAFNSLEKA